MREIGAPTGMLRESTDKGKGRIGIMSSDSRFPAIPRFLQREHIIKRKTKWISWKEEDAGPISWDYGDRRSNLDQLLQLFDIGISHTDAAFRSQGSNRVRGMGSVNRYSAPGLS